MSGPSGRPIVYSCIASADAHAVTLLKAVS